MENKTLRVVIIDDEHDAIEVLKTLLCDFCEGVDIVGTADSLIEGVKIINSQSPDLVLLDIEMPGGTGFDVLEATEDQNFRVIFTTAYDHYAIKAIKHNALDYLMKPIDIEELSEALEVARENIETDHQVVNKELINTLASNQFKKIALSTKDGYEFVAYKEIQYLQSEGAYTKFVGENEYVVSKNLKNYEEIMPSHFLRISNSHIININNVKSYLREDGGVLLMHNGHKIPVSRAKKSFLKEKLGM